MNVFNYYEQQRSFNVEMLNRLCQLRSSILQCNNIISILKLQIFRLNFQNNMLQWTIANMQPIRIDNIHISRDVNLDQLKVNSIQSGAALNVGEWIHSKTNSDMDMEMGSNSMNSGDSNEMRNFVDDISRSEDMNNL